MPPMSVALLLQEVTREFHRPDCRRYPQPKPGWFLRCEAIVTELIQFRFDYGRNLDACAARPVLFGRGRSTYCAEDVKCCSCDLERAEWAFYRMRGGDYGIPDCCARPRRPALSAQKRMNRIAEQWELDVPFPLKRVRLRASAPVVV